MHGGKSTGAPKGNHNAWKHGDYGRVAVEFFDVVRGLLKQCNTIDDIISGK
jgi:hypothetical protein